ncbi:MAG: hypothetical protein CSA62_07740 [Planctomycetota bacterium]|nr:MAG: hypothetical protein CSA62_07740 [Planctomycetota bacterium]
MRKLLDWLWHERIEQLPKWQRPLAFLVRILLRSFLRFWRKDGPTRCAGLTYWTLMALVPVLAVVFAVAGAFGIRSELEDSIRSSLLEYPLQARDFVDEALLVVQHVDLKALSAVAILGLLYTAFTLMARIEAAFNATWKAARARALARRYADYVAIMFLVPLLVLASTSATAFLQSPVLRDSAPWLADTLRESFSFLPLALLWMAAALLLKVTPNAEVRWMPALVAGLVIAVMYLAMQKLFFLLQIGVTQANAIYGTLAFLPLFLIYLHASWSIVIIGAELSHSLQYREFVLRPQEERLWTPERRRQVGLFLLRESMRRYESAGVLTISEAASRLGVQALQVRDVAKVLERAGLLHRVRKGQALVPARLPGEIRAGELFVALDSEGEHPEKGRGDQADLALLARVRDALKDFDDPL